MVRGEEAWRVGEEIGSGSYDLSVLLSLDIGGFIGIILLKEKTAYEIA